MNKLTKKNTDGSFSVADNLPCGENSYEFKDLLIDALGKYEEVSTQKCIVIGKCASCPFKAISIGNPLCSLLQDGCFVPVDHHCWIKDVQTIKQDCPLPEIKDLLEK